MKNKIKTLPNLITLIRLISIPFIIYLILNDRSFLAAVLFVIVVLSDKLDGYLARKLKQSSYYGGMFDAATDTILIFSTIIILFIKGYLTINILIVLLIPKIVTGIFLGAIHKAVYKPTIFSRISSVFLYIIIPLYLLSINNLILQILILLLYIASVIHWVYLIRGR